MCIVDYWVSCRNCEGRGCDACGAVGTFNVTDNPFDLDGPAFAISENVYLKSENERLAKQCELQAFALKRATIPVSSF